MCAEQNPQSTRPGPRPVSHLLLILSLILLFFLRSTLAQEAIATGGGLATGTEGTATYTVGVVFYRALHPLSPGIQQAYEWTAVEMDEAILAFPNPTSHTLKLKRQEHDRRDLWFQLHDAKGALLLSDQMVGNETHIELGYLVPSLYFLRVLHGSQVIETFRIIKQ